MHMFKRLKRKTLTRYTEKLIKILHYQKLNNVLQKIGREMLLNTLWPSSKLFGIYY